MEPVAIVGLALKFPQNATSPQGFWDMLVQQRCAMTDFPSSRLNVDAFYQPNISYRNTLPLRGGHFIQEDLGAFDAGFFGITPTEAAAMDPAQRGVLEIAYQAFENAGIPLKRASGSATSVHTGCFTDDYKLQLLKDPEQIPKYAATGASLAMLANRLSWFFNLTGPSMNIDSACSSSGTAVDHACQLLRNRDCDMSVVAGCNITFVSDYTALLTKMGFLSPDSRCYTFDHRANGYARGEGIAVVILQRLSDAIRDRNTIRAVIRSTGSNQDAHTPGITQPSSKAQERLIRETYRKAGLSMKLTRFVEAHGTGTQIGDTIETTAIGNAFRACRDLKEPLYVGAVKTNIGHLEGASGLAGLIKAILVLETGAIPPNTNFKHINERIDTEYLRIALPLTSIPWPTDSLRRISINSFGFGGSNSHVVLDDAFNYLRDHNLAGIHCTARTPPNPEDLGLRPGLSAHKDDYNPSMQGDKSVATPNPFRTPKLLVFSASDQEGPKRIATKFQEHLSNILDRNINHDAYLNDLAYTLDTRRSLLLWRSYVTLDSLSGVHSLADRLSIPSIVKSTSPKLCFIFTGQGAQWYAMGRELFNYPVYNESMENATTFLQSLGCAWSPIDELTKSEAESRINEPEYSQPLCTVLQVALVDLLDSIGIAPAAVMGHSSGEIAAAYCAGAISQESAWKLAYYRGQVAALVHSRSSISGAMLSVALSAEDMIPYLSRIEQNAAHLPTTISCFNSDNNVTVSGSAYQINLLKADLDKDGVFARKLRIAVAYHSKQMDQVAEDYSVLIGDITSNDTKRSVPIVSSVTGLPIDPIELRRNEYWVKNMTSPVRFLEAMRRLCLQHKGSLTKKIDRSHYDAIFTDHLLEIGPHAALQAPIRDCLDHINRGEEIAYSSALYRNKSALDTLLNLSGFLHAVGVPVDLRKINDPLERNRNIRNTLTDLPGYPFDHGTSYWYESRISSDYRLRSHGHVQLLGSPSSDWNPLDAQWRNILHSDDASWAEDHKISGAQLCPGAAMIVMAIEAITQLAESEQNVIGYTLRDIDFGVALPLYPTSGEIETRFSLRSSNTAHSQDDRWYSFSLYSLKAKKWTEHCTGSIKLECALNEKLGRSLRSATYYEDLWGSRTLKCKFPIDTKEMYGFLQRRGIDYGPTFRRMTHLSCSSEGEMVGKISLLNEPDSHFFGSRTIHAAALDAVMHSVFVAASKGATLDIDTQVPTAIKTMWISHDGLRTKRDQSILITTSLDAQTPLSAISSSIALDDKAEHVLIRIDSLRMSTIAKLPPTTHPSPGGNQVWSIMRSSIDVDLLTKDQELHWLNTIHSKIRPDMVSFFQEVRTYLKNVLLRTRTRLELSSQAASQSHLHRYLRWMDWQLDIESVSRLQHLSCQEFDEIGDRIRNEGPVGSLFSKVARHLGEVLQERTDALHLLFEDDAVKRFYETLATSSTYYDKLQGFLAATTMKRPNMRILEVGAGTGVFTRMVLEGLSVRYEGNLQARMFDKYYFTDITPSFFENARSDFLEYGSKITYEVFDMEKGLAKQGQRHASYDLIIAANVLHIATNLGNCLRSLRELLKPRGKLILHETTTPVDITTGFIFGLLPDWWSSSEPHRAMSPLLTEHDWHLLLKENGFSGTDIVIPDSEILDCHQSSVMITTALEESRSPCAIPAVMIIINRSSQDQQLLAEGIREQLGEFHGSEVFVLSIEEVSERRSESAVRLFLWETEYPVLADISSTMFSNLQSCLRHTDQALWVTSGGGKKPTDPGFGVVDGFARALRLERNELKFVVLALDPAICGMLHKIGHITQVISQSFSPSKDPKSYESEYVELQGALHVRRLSPANALQTDMVERLQGRQLRAQRLSESKPVEVNVVSPGQLDGIAIVAKMDSTTVDLEYNEIEVDVRAVGLNSTDLVQALESTEEVTLGYECAGIVRRIPAGVASNFRVGDRVCTLGTRLCQSYARVLQERVAIIPGEISFEQASVLPFVSWLASYLIDEVAQVSKDELLLVYCGSGVLGQLCIQLALKTQANIHAAAGSEEDRRILRERFALPDNCIHSKESLLNLPGPMGFKNRYDVVLDVSEDKDYTDLLVSIRPFGRFVLVDGMIKPPRESRTVSDLRSNVTISVVDPTSVSQMYLRRIHRPLQQIFDRIGNELTRTQVIELCNISNVVQVLRQLKELDFGKRLVICMNEDDEIPLTKAVTAEYDFDSKSTYLIAGGLGGLGRCVARWMVSRGALNLILLSRLGPRTPSALEMISTMIAQGVRVQTPACDAADLAALKMTLNKCSETLPPLRGCIQASGRIHDTWYDEMSFEDWKTVTQPKIQASWNLHALLPKGMDFFILTASISGIFGQITQVNYASGNTYQDALAKFRIAQGEKAASLDLGLLLVDGLLKDKPELVERLNSTGYFIPLSEPDIIAIFDRYCNPSLTLSPGEEQPIIGIQSPIVLKTQGVELPQSMQQPLWYELVSSGHETPRTTETAHHNLDLATMLKSTNSQSEAETIVDEAILNKVAQLLTIPPEKLDADRPIHHYGVDSLTAVDIRNWLSKTFAVAVSTFEILGDFSINDLGLSVLRKFKEAET